MEIKVGSELFKKELNLIKNEKIKTFVCDLLDNYIHYDNFLKASSSSGKYHPDFDNGMYGNTNHTKAVVKLCNNLLTSRIDMSELLKDIIYASAILHDMWKYDGNSVHTNNNHALIAYDWLIKYRKELKDEELIEYIDKISTIVLFHMGHWSMEENKWINELNKINEISLRDAILIVHYSDMIASRKFYNITNFAL